VINSIRENLQALTTAARSAQVMMSASVLHGMVVMVDQILKTPATNINEDFIARIGKVNIDAINFLWNLSVKIKSGSDEEPLLIEPETKKKIRGNRGSSENHSLRSGLFIMTPLTESASKD